MRLRTKINFQMKVYAQIVHKVTKEKKRIFVHFILKYFFLSFGECIVEHLLYVRRKIFYFTRTE